MTKCPPINRSDIEKRLRAEFDKWFAELQRRAVVKLDPDDWVGYWQAGYSPSDVALEIDR